MDITPAPSKESGEMVNVELHRAESMSKSSDDIVTDVKEGMFPGKNKDVFTYISTTAGTVFSEIKQLKIEVIMFLYMFSAVMRNVSSTAMIMDKVCLFHLGLKEDICQNLADHDDIKSEVEKIANNYSVGRSMISMVPSAILACFIGSWSDKYGRKIPIISALLGIILDGLGSTICAGIFSSRVEYYLIPAVFTGISGGFIAVLTVLYSYASDITTFGQRTMKYTIMEITFGLSMPLGQVAGGWLFKYSGYVSVFMTSTAGHVIGLAWVLFVLKETKGLDNQDSWKVKLRSLWSTQPVIDSFRATIKPRPNKGREQILLLILAMSIAVLSFASTSSIDFLYVHHLYNWENTQFSTISAVFSVIGTLCMFIAVPIFRRIGFDDPALGIAGSASLLLKYIALGLATKPGIYFLANFLGLLGSLGTLAGRSRISKVASKNDIGKVFAFLTTAESILPIIAAAVASQIFNATLNVYPGIIYLGIGCLVVIPEGIYIWLARLPAVNYEEMYNNSEQDDEAAVKKTSENKSQDLKNTA